MKKLFIITAICAGAVTNSFAQSIPLDTFESYADQAAFEASWTVDLPGTTLMTDGGHSGSKYFRTGTTTAGRVSKAVSLTPTDSAPVEVSFWVRPQGAGLGRSFIQLEAPGAQIINYGVYNEDAGTGWAARVLGGGAPGTWDQIGGTRQNNVWTNLKIVIKSRSVQFYENDVLINTQSRTLSDFPAFSVFRIGFSPTSSAIAVDYDDVSVTTIASVEAWNLY